MGLINRIKKSGTNSRTHFETKEEEKLRQYLNTLLLLPKKPEEEAELVRSVITRGEESQERTGLHGSAFIVPDTKWCTRAHVLSMIYRQNPQHDFPISLLRIFEEGNAIHEKWQRLLIRGGNGDASTFDVTQLHEKYQIKFTPDIIGTFPTLYGDEIIVGEIKSVNTYQFQKMSKHPTASKQLQWYLFLTGLKKGFVLNEDKNNQEIKVEIYDYDPEIAGKYTDRAESVTKGFDLLVKDGKLPKRPTDAVSIESNRCKDCHMRDACWNVGIGRRLY